MVADREHLLPGISTAAGHVEFTPANLLGTDVIAYLICATDYMQISGISMTPEWTPFRVSLTHRVRPLTHFLALIFEVSSSLVSPLRLC